MPQRERSVTVPEPFDLRSVRKENHNPTSLQSPFRARPMPDFSKSYMPVTGMAKPCMPSNLTLCTDQRAEKRALFQERVKEELRRKELQRAAEATEKARREAEEVQRIRKQTEFKARPMPVYNYFSVTRSNTDLTVPHAPQLCTDRTPHTSVFMSTQPSVDEPDDIEMGE